MWILSRPPVPNAYGMTSAIKKGVSKAVSKATMSSDTEDSAAGLVDPRDTAKYLLQVTAGPSADESKHGIVQVNKGTYEISSSKMKAQIWVRIQDYHGLPRSSPSTNSYFSDPLHTKDCYSISFSFTPSVPIAGSDLVMGFDFDRPIRDRLPPGIGTVLRFATTMIDPGIYADPYSDKPYLYGPGLSSFFILNIGEKGRKNTAKPPEVIQEGAAGSGAKVREELGIPENSEKRRKHFLKQENLDAFTFEPGREYSADFFNPYLDFANFAVKLPGFSISVAKYIDEKTHKLRYVLKNRRTGEVYFAIVFTLLFGDHLAQALKEDESSTQRKKPAKIERR